MAITTKNRKQLKSYFVKNAIPTEGNFADFVDATLNQAEDGVFKLAGEPLSVVSAPGEQKRVLRFYTNYPAPNADWQISLSPAQNPADPATVRPGFGVTDGAGNTRLYIDPTTGNIGLGTNNPADKLTVIGGDLRVEGGRHRRLKLVSDSYHTGIELVARNKGEAGYPYIDFTMGELDKTDYGIRILTTDNKTFRVESQFGPPTLYVKSGNITYDGVLNKLDTAEQVGATVRAHDFILGHTGRRGKPGRALVDNTEALVLNFGKDWPRAEVQSPLFIDGTLGVGTRTPAGPLEVRVPGLAGWDKFIVTADASWGSGNQHVTVGGGGAAGLMINNPHIPWIKAENRASIRYGLSGGVPGGATWDVGARPNNAFSAALNNADQRLWLTADGKVGINCNDPAGALDVRVPGAAGTWDRFVVGSTNLWGDGNTQYVTIGAHGAAGLMINNPHVPWQPGDKRASIRYGRSGGVQAGLYWDVGVREGNLFSFGCSNGNVPLVMKSDGLVGIGTAAPTDRLHVDGKARITSGAVLGSICIGGSEHGPANWAYETIQLNPTHNLRIWFGKTERFMMAHDGAFTIRFNNGYWMFQPDGNLVKYRNNGSVVWALNNGW